MDNKLNNKLPIEKLFTVYSINEIIETLNTLNEKIDSLISCSSDDFHILNKNFKHYNEELKGITDNASELIELITNKDNRDLYRQIQAEKNKAFSLLEIQKNKISESGQSFEKISNYILRLVIPIKNFKQDLKTLKLISTNLKLDPKLIKYHKKISVLLNTINRSFPNLELNLEKIKTYIHHAIHTINTLESNYLDQISSKIQLIDHVAEELLRKQNEAEKLLPILEKKIESSREYTSKIITNLQYQDIVRQKIEHVQNTHNEILDKLKNFSKDSNQPRDLLSKAKLFIKIRDVAGLQAAQLIHANREYQNAIETITSKFLDIGTMMEDLGDMCKSIQEFRKLNVRSEHLTFDGFHSSNSHLKTDVDTLVDLYKIQIDSLLPQIEILGTNYGILREFSKTFQTLTQHMSEMLNGKKYDNQFDTRAINQLTKVSQNLIDLIRKTETNIISIDKTVEQLYDSIQGTESKANSKELVTAVKSIILHSESMTKNSILTHKLSDSEEELYRIAQKIKDGVDEVKYYDLFEKEIEEIIGHLEEISKKLMIEEDLELDDEDNSIAELKKKYTMETEFLIHEKISNEMDKGSVDLFDSESMSDVKTDEDSDVEFF